MRPDNRAVSVGQLLRFLQAIRATKRPGNRKAA